MGSCPHPRGAVERIVGPRTDIVCPDCHERLELPEPEPGEEMPEIELCSFQKGDRYCGKPFGHDGNHRYEA